jgi:hypothetical protein
MLATRLFSYGNPVNIFLVQVGMLGELARAEGVTP